MKPVEMKPNDSFFDSKRSIAGWPDLSRDRDLSRKTVAPRRSCVARRESDRSGAAAWSRPACRLGVEVTRSYEEAKGNGVPRLLRNFASSRDRLLTSDS